MNRCVLVMSSTPPVLSMSMELRVLLVSAGGRQRAIPGDGKQVLLKG